MTSLTQLNESAAQPIEVTDLRPAGVLFDRFATRDDIFTVSNLNRPLVPTIGIEEIINYSTANVRYRFTINSTRSQFITGSTLTFNGMPTGVSVASSSTTFTKTYTVSGLKSAKQFDQIKTPTWNIPSDYALSNTWWVKTEVLYYDAELDIETSRSWLVFDPEYYYFAQLTAESTIAATVGNKKPLRAALSASFDFNSDAPFKNFAMATTAQSFVTANGRKVRLLRANLSTPGFTLSAQGKFFRLDLRAGLSASSTLVCRAGEYVRLVNRADFTGVFGNIGPGGVSFIEGNGFAYATGLGSWPQGFPGIVRIKALAATITATSTVTCIGADARLVSAMVMSSGTMTVTPTRIPGIIRNLTANFSVNLPDGGNIEGARAQFGGEFGLTALLSNIKLVSADITSSSSVDVNLTSDAPAIPTLNFTTNEVTTAQTFVTGAGGLYYTMAIVGKRSDGYHRIWVRNAGSGTIRLAHNDTQSTSSVQILASTSSQNTVSTQVVSDFSTSTTDGTAFAVSTGIGVRAHLISVQNWSSTTTQTSFAQQVSGGRGTEFNLNLSGPSIALCPQYNSSTQQAIVVYYNNSNYNILQSKHRWTTNTFDYTSSATSSTGATSGSANHQKIIRVSGFTSNDTTARYAFSYFDSFTTMKIRICTTSTADDSAATAVSTGDVFTIPLVDGSVVINNGGLATVWDDYANSKFVSVAMAADQGNIFLRAVRVDDWSTLTSTLGAQKTVTGYADDVDTSTARLIPIKTANGIVGQALLTYQRTNTDDAIYGRLISVNSSTLQVDIGAETYLGSSNASTSVAIQIGDYVIDMAKDGNEYAFSLSWKERNSPTTNNRGGSTFTTATGT
jgi:hypothetical protein